MHDIFQSRFEVIVNIRRIRSKNTMLMAAAVLLIAGDAMPVPPRFGFINDGSSAFAQDRFQGAPPAIHEAASGPLTVHRQNPRYFADPQGNVVYLTGSHTWASLIERRLPDGPLFNYAAYLQFLERFDHNFFRMWAWEHAAWMQFTDLMVIYHPHPYPRTGPGRALDGRPRFDLSRFDERYFERLRDRVKTAGDRGIYVAVMLFQGFSIEQKLGEGVDPFVGNPWEGHPFHRKNNASGIDGDLNRNDEGEEVHTLANPSVTKIQEAYVRKVIDTLNDLDNVLFEISNESHGQSTEWQYHMINLIHEYEKTKPKQHPVGMTFQFGQGKSRGTSKALFESPADWISLSADGGYREDPPAADGRKVIISDTDHIWGIGGNVEWVWKTFTRGQNPVFMDPYRDLRGRKSFAPEDRHRYDEGWDPMRAAMGDTRRLAENIDLARMIPHPELASTKYCLADPGYDYLVFLPGGDPVTVDLTEVNGTFVAEWFDPHSGVSKHGDRTDGGSQREFQSPFPQGAVLHLYIAN